MGSLLQLRRITLRHFQGTFWYHSHYANQYCDGLRGAFVVRDPADPQAYLYDIDDGIPSRFPDGVLGYN
jgi:FtsP/CotA-like multicopper oxidase with cupredoxin domain